MNKLVKTNKLDSNQYNIDELYNKISKHIENARNKIQHSIDTEMVDSYWLIGRDIIEEEQNGETRAQYGKYLLVALSKRLTLQHGRGFSIENLQKMRKFYLTYIDFEPISSAVRTELKLNPNLGWTHYRALMRIKNLAARKFYEIESVKNSWAARELERQIASLLYDRVAKSKNKDELLRLASHGHEIIKASDAIKDPMVLEFLDVPESNKLVESELEEELINNLQKFMLELGKGMAYVGRQKRITFDSNHLYCDLVFYSIPLKSYIIIDIKTRSLTHADLGQIQLYINYFDKEIKMENDNPTIGLILCTEKSDKMVEYFIGNNSQNIFASTYQFNLPSIEQLEKEIHREIEQYKLSHITDVDDSLDSD